MCNQDSIFKIQMPPKEDKNVRNTCTAVVYEMEILKDPEY